MPGTRRTSRCRWRRRTRRARRATITAGMMASPSSPSVRFTALLMPTIMKYDSTMNATAPSGSAKFLKNGRNSVVSRRRLARCRTGTSPRPRPATDCQKYFQRAIRPLEFFFDQLQVVVVEADQAERERDAEHDPDEAVATGRPTAACSRRWRRGSARRPWSACRPWRNAIFGPSSRTTWPIWPRLSRSIIHGPMQQRERERRDHREDGAHASGTRRR